MSEPEGRRMSQRQSVASGRRACPLPAFLAVSAALLALPPMGIAAQVPGPSSPAPAGPANDPMTRSFQVEVTGEVMLLTCRSAPSRSTPAAR